VKCYCTGFTDSAKNGAEPLSCWTWRAVAGPDSVALFAAMAQSVMDLEAPAKLHYCARCQPAYDEYTKLVEAEMEDLRAALRETEVMGANELVRTVFEAAADARAVLADRRLASCRHRGFVFCESCAPVFESDARSLKAQRAALEARLP